METKILVIYVGVAGIRSEDIDTYVHKVASKILPTTFQGESIVIPIQSYDTRVECINPKYITDENAIRENTEMLKKLREQLLHQAELIKKEKYE